MEYGWILAFLAYKWWWVSEECANGGISKKNLVACLYMYDKWNFKPQISSIFYFNQVSDGRMSHVLGVNEKNGQPFIQNIKRSSKKPFHTLFFKRKHRQIVPNFNVLIRLLGTQNPLIQIRNCWRLNTCFSIES